MISRDIESSIRTILSQELNTSITSFRYETVGGGSINEAYQLVINDRLQLFCKMNSSEKFPKLFEKEKRGLELLDTQNTIRVPKIIVCNGAFSYQLLIMEWITGGLKTEKFWENFGEHLARLHFISNSVFGLEEDNYMGALPQSNKQHDIWVDFLINERFVPQLTRALKNNLLEPIHGRKFENLFKKLSSIFAVEQPSLLHGDLWSGNFLADENGKPVLIDPAVYFGHRSMDLGMTTLFGGFDKRFYEAYHYHFPLPKNYYQQWEICNLYPLLIHLNLFGKSYQRDIVNTISKY